MTNVLMDRVVRIFSEAQWQQPDQDFVATAMALLSLAIAKQPPEKREETLAAIEQNLKTLANHIWRPPRQAPVQCCA